MHWFSYIIPAVNFVLLIVVLRQLIAVRRPEPPRAVCLRTGQGCCIAVAEPGLLCVACRGRLNQRIQEMASNVQ